MQINFFTFLYISIAITMSYAIFVIVFTIVGVPTSMDNNSKNEVIIVQSASSLDDNAYNPNPVNIKNGDKITWINNDIVIHTVTNNSTSVLEFDSSLLKPDDVFSFTFNEFGSFQYYCKFHPNMQGIIKVNDN